VCALQVFSRSCKAIVGPLSTAAFIYTPPVLTLHTSRVCPHGLFVCLICFAELTAIRPASLYSTSPWVFVVETHYVFCEVLNGVLGFSRKILGSRMLTRAPEVV